MSRGTARAARSDGVAALAAEAVAAHGGTILRRMANDPRLDDPETIHDVRVASRRLREALAVFRAAIPERRRRRLLDTARRLTRRLGETRNADVGAALLREWIARAEERGGPRAWVAAAPAASALAKRLEARARRLRIAAGPAGRRDARRLRRRVRRVARALERGKVPRGGAPVGEGDIARAEIATRTARLFRHASGWSDPANIEALHATRIAAKRLRYTLELFDRRTGPGFADRLALVKAVQESLGRHHDASVLLDEASRWEESGALAMRAAGRGAWRALEARLVEERRRWHTRFLEHLEGWREDTFTSFLLDGMGARAAEVPLPSGARPA